MTSENKAPERIWAVPEYNECWTKPLEEDDVEYVRADLYAAQAAEIARLTAERDRFEAALGRACLVGGTTYLVDRAKKAEAERDAALSEVQALIAVSIKGLQDQIGKLLGILDDWDKSRADEHNGGLTMHTYGMSPDWYVEAAFWSCYGCGPQDSPADATAALAARDAAMIARGMREAAGIAYRTCAETMHVTLWRQAEAAILARAAQVEKDAGKLPSPATTHGGCKARPKSLSLSW